MGKGRKPKPTALKIIAGVPTERINTREPKRLVGKFVAPDNLKGYALERWNELVPVLNEMGVLSKSDLDTLANYCLTYGRWRDASEHVNEMGQVITGYNGGPVINPWVKIELDTRRDLLRMQAEFGLSPSSRTKVKTGQAESNPLLEFLARKPG